MRAYFYFLISLLELLLLSEALSFEDLSLYTALSFISADSLKKHVEFLGSDSLKGRGTGTHGGEMAAQYIARHLKRLQLKPAGDDGTYFQVIPMHGSFPLPGSRLQLFSQGKEYNFELEKDYLLYKSGAQTFIPQPVPLVFVGYGIVAPEYDYNDYQSLDVDGKIVVFLSGEPHSNNPTYFKGTNPSIYSYPESKQRIAISRGARGSIMIPTPKDEKGRSWQSWINKFAFEDVVLAYSVTANLSIVINPYAAEKLFDGALYNLHQIFKMDKANTIRSFPLNVKISFRGEFKERDFFAKNVIGLWKGNNQKPDDNYLIISAHYDHLGIGTAVKGDSIYNGVFDNAVGVAALLEIARVFSLMPERPRHSVIFVFTTGEEKGLLGSTYYLDHPAVPLYKTIANINVDGLAMFDTFNDVVGVGAELSTLGEHLKKVACELGLEVSSIPSQFLSAESFVRSDQIAFAKAGIPSILIMEGLNYKNISQDQGLRLMIDWQQRIYHSPFDDLNQPMNFQAACQHCQIIFAFCNYLANSSVEPEWQPGTPYINARLRSIVEKR